MVVLLVATNIFGASVWWCAVILIFLALVCAVVPVLREDHDCARGREHESNVGFQDRGVGIVVAAVVVLSVDVAG